MWCSEEKDTTEPLGQFIARAVFLGKNVCLPDILVYLNTLGVYKHLTFLITSPPIEWPMSMIGLS